MIDRACQAHPARTLKLVGITGDSGRTTTSYLTAAVLAAGGWRSGVLGSLGYFDGNEWQDASSATPPPPVLANWLSRIAAECCTHAVLEVSRGAIENRRVDELEFDVACVTRVGNARRIPDRCNGRDKAAGLFDQLLPEGFAVVNADDPATESLLARLDGPVLTFGMRGAAELTALPLEQSISEQMFLLSVGDESIPMRTPLIGNQNIYNCLAAAAIGLAYGIDLPTIVQGMEAVERVPGRLERLECGQPFGVFVDRARAPGALTRCLKTLRAVTSGRLICVFGASGDRDKSRRAVASVADLAVITSDPPLAVAAPMVGREGSGFRVQGSGERPDAVAAHVVGGFRNRSAVRVILDRRAAIGWALGQAQPGDCVLIAGNTPQAAQTIGHERYAFDDRQVARQWLYEAMPGERLHRASA